MYRVNKPIRIAKNEKNNFIISIPRVQLRVEVNDNVALFLQYLEEKGEFDDNIVTEFIKQNKINNTNDYVELYKEMKQLEIIVNYE